MYYLTTTETRVLQGLVKELSTVEIGAELDMKIKSVQYVRSNLKKKLNYASNVGILMKALKLGFFNEYLNCVPEAKYMFRMDQNLTLAEGMYLNLLLHDFSKQQIALQMDSSSYRVSQFRRRLYDKWGIQSVPDLIIKAVHKGFIRLIPCQPNLSDSISKESKMALWSVLKNSQKRHNGSLYPLCYDIEFYHATLDEVSLNFKEMNQLRMHLTGKSDAAISAELEIAVRTVHRYKLKIKKKLGADTTGELIKKSIRAGILQLIPESSRFDMSGSERKLLLLVARSTPLEEISELLKVPPRLVADRIHLIKSHWNVSSDEGLIVQALRKSVLTLASL